MREHTVLQKYIVRIYVFIYLSTVKYVIYKNICEHYVILHVNSKQCKQK